MTTTQSKKFAMNERIEKHGRQLLAIFHNATEQEPAKLCRMLRRIEHRGQTFALKLCNGPPYPSEEAEDAEANAIINQANDLLKFAGKIPVILNRDPRGYALKIDDEYMRKHDIQLHRDWGGYGIIAPDLTDA